MKNDWPKDKINLKKKNRIYLKRIVKKLKKKMFIKIIEKKKKNRKEKTNSIK